MKSNNLFAFSLFSIVLGRIARPGRLPISHDEEPVVLEKSRATAFLITDAGLRIQCWEIGEMLSDSRILSSDPSKQPVRTMEFGAPVHVAIVTIPPNTEFARVSSTGVHTGATDFRVKPILYTIKDGLFAATSNSISNGLGTSEESFDESVFADLNGDDWFYFEDTSTEPAPRAQCTKNEGEDMLKFRTVSGGDTTIMLFQHEERPSHKVLHEGKCNFAGLKPVSPSKKAIDYDSPRLSYQDL